MMADGELAPLVLERRLAAPGPQPGPSFCLPLTAAERTVLRGRRLSACGQPLLLQLPRGAALRPGEWLAMADGLPLVLVLLSVLA